MLEEVGEARQLNLKSSPGPEADAAYISDLRTSSCFFYIIAEPDEFSMYALLFCDSAFVSFSQFIDRLAPEPFTATIVNNAARNKEPDIKI